jgi:DNA-binding NarL/FixJ family response regulator
MEKKQVPAGSPPATTIPVVSTPNQTFTPTVRVWLVDDNDTLRTLVAEMLSELGGIDCARHFSSPDALLSALASKPGPDVILLDVQMGDHNGLDALRPIKSLTRSTRVLMFTTSFDPEWRDRAFGEGASDYLLKSETMERVAARIRNPADDPAPDWASRHRADCVSERMSKSRQASSITERTPRLLSRTLKMLRLLSN